MRVLFMTNVPSPYRVDFFNELGKKCDLTVTFEKRTSDERDKSWKEYRFDNFKGVFLKGKSVNTDTAVCRQIVKYVKDRSYDRIVCADFCSPTGMIAIQYMKRHDILYWLESDGGSPKNGKGIKERLKRHFISGADGYFSTSQEHDNYYLAYGAERQKIHRYPFTSLYENDILDIPLSSDAKLSLRKKLGMTERKIVISVGRFSYLGGYGKGFDTLIRIADRLHETGIYIIGDQPTEEFLLMQKQYDAFNVHFIGYMNKTDLKEYYQAADLFVLMSLGEAWGLVVNEAMANGLPVVVSDHCVAGLELVKNGANGYVIPMGNDDELCEKVVEICSDEKKCERMSASAIETIRPYTIEHMAQTHIDVKKE